MHYARYKKKQQLKKTLNTINKEMDIKTCTSKCKYSLLVALQFHVLNIFTSYRHGKWLLKT